MPTRLLTEEPLVPELEAIAVAAAEELRGLMDENHEGEQGPGSSLCPRGERRHRSRHATRGDRTRRTQSGKHVRDMS